MRAWLDANAKKRSGKRDLSAEDMENGAANQMAALQGVAEGQGESRLCPHHLAEGHGRYRRHADAAASSSARKRRSTTSANGGPFAIGLGMCIPTLMAYGTEEAKKRYVGPAVQGEEIWCQLFSEPAGGSDVADLRTRAEKNGDTWTINGSEDLDDGRAVLRLRHHPDAHRPQCAQAQGPDDVLPVDEGSPGVDIRPIKQASGGSGFNEIFFTDVKMQDCQRLGEVGQGWTGRAHHADA